MQNIHLVSGKPDVLWKASKITRNSRICGYIFKVKPHNKAVYISRSLVVQMQDQSWWVVRFNWVRVLPGK